ncbi:MAG: O-methyltransferase [Anaerolineales bacterium]|jgi:predicted O-methyltransferase YrrM
MSTDLNYDTVQEFLIDIVPMREPEMQRMEKYARENNFPIIGPAAGYNCYQIARMIAAKSIFEMGSGYGYSTAWFARAVQETCAEERTNGVGVVHYTVWDEKLSKMAAGHLSRLGFDGLIEYHTAEAVETLRNTPGQFDLIFNDIDKEGYPDSLPVIKDKLRSGGVLIVDNILWSGRVFDQEEKSNSTESIREFTRLITSDSDWITSITPIRDGLIIAYKK